MAQRTSIEWTRGDDGAAGCTWNVVTGCDRISPGCDHCYALALAKRLKAMGAAKYQTDGDPRTSGPGFGVAFHEAALKDPLRWRKPRRVFVNSMSDLAHARVSDDQVARVFAVMALARRHTFQVLTKRPGRLRRLLVKPAFWDQVLAAAWGLSNGGDDVVDVFAEGPLPNVWIGASVESNAYVWRAEQVRHMSASVRFLSLEPLLGPVPDLELGGVDWVIVGGESGPGHRPLDLDWVRQIRDRCVDQDVAFFFKQVGGRTSKAGGRTLDGHTWDEYPVVRRSTRVTA